MRYIFAERAQTSISAHHWTVTHYLIRYHKQTDSCLAVSSKMVKDAARAEQEVEVRFMFGHTVHGSEGKNVTRRIWVQAEGNDSVQEVKAKISVRTAS